MGDGSDENGSVQDPMDESGSETEGLRQEASAVDHDEPWILQRNDEIWFTTASIESDQERSRKESLIGEMVRSRLDQPLMTLNHIEYDEALIEPYTDSDVWVGQHTVILKDAWNDAWKRYESRFDTSFEDLLAKIRQYDDANQRYSIAPRGHVQYFVKPQRSGRTQFISLYDEWLHRHETVDLERLNDPEYMQLLKETTLEQIPERVK